jgi:RNA polymerase sigma factor (sigma-70 family)
MKLEREFDRRIAAIHGLDRTAHAASNIEESAMDTRHEEFQAMTGVFLGNDFDRGKLWLVESLQRALHERQAELYRLFGAHELAPEEYVESLNTLLADTFAACEVILGTENFVKLFGAPRSELAGFIDRDAFLQANPRDEINSLTAEETDTSDTPQSDATIILEALSQLSETEQQIIRLIYLENLSFDEIAQTLDLKVSNVIKIRQRATKKLGKLRDIERRVG